MEHLLKDFPITIEIPTAWGEMDAFQHVNGVVYFRHFESARFTYFERLGMIDYMKETGTGPILASIECKYFQSCLRQGRGGETLPLGSKGHSPFEIPGIRLVN